MLAMQQIKPTYPKALTYSWWEQFELTERETEVAVCLSDGMKPAQIASKLCICARTVRHHIRHITQKVKADNALHAAIILHRFRKLN